MKPVTRLGLWAVVLGFFLLAWLWIRYEIGAQERRQMHAGFRTLEFYAAKLISEKPVAGSDPGYIESASELARYVPMGDPTVGAVGNPFPGILPEEEYVVRTVPTTSPDDILIYDTIVRGGRRFRLYADGEYEFVDDVTTDGREGREKYSRLRRSTTRP
jgi:hypothetical protein